MRIEKAGHEITTVEEWHRYAPPKKSEEHWVDGRSAKEAAKAWVECPSQAPKEVLGLLKSNDEFTDLILDRAEPEAKLSFDDFRNPREADLCIWAHDPKGVVAITVEAKADEPFDDTVADTLAKCLERVVENPRSAGVTRTAQLAQSLFNARGSNEEFITDLRYQLLTATAGTLAHAARIGASRAIVVVHQFITSAMSSSGLIRNDADLSRFLKRLSRGRVESLDADRLAGPFMVPGEPLFFEPATLYIGKAVRKIGEPRA